MNSSASKKAKPTGQKSKAPRSGAITSQARAGLILAPARVLRLMKKDRLNARVGKGPAVVMAAVMEYVTAEIIEIATEQAKKAGRNRIKPRDIQLALSQDEELGRLCHNAIIAEGGRPVHIEPALLPRKGKKGVEAGPTQEM